MTQDCADGVGRAKQAEQALIGKKLSDDVLEAAGKAKVPFTSGILIGSHAARAVQEETRLRSDTGAGR